MSNTAVVAAICLVVACGPTQPPSAASPSAERTTYSRDIAPLLQQHCQSCHQLGGLGPFPLDSYSDAAAHASEIKEAVISRRMPHGLSVRLETGCSNETTFEGPRRLIQSEIDTISRWVDAGAPQGNPAEVPTPRTREAGHRAAELNVLIANDEQGFFLPPNLGRDVFRRFVVDTNFDADRFLTGFEAFPGSEGGKGVAHVVHHVTLFIDASRSARDQQAQFQSSAPQLGGPGFEGDFTYPTALVGMWFPGGPPLSMAAGCGIRIPQGASVIMEVHYGRVSSGVVDKTQVELHLASTVADEIQTSLVKNETIFLPAGAAEVRVQATRTFPTATILYAITPHMHQLGTSFEVSVEVPGGNSCLADIQWDFEHQGTYRLTHPMTLPAGSTIRTECIYDNSAANPNQLNNPPRDIDFGRATDHEMCQLTIATSAAPRSR